MHLFTVALSLAVLFGQQSADAKCGWDLYQLDATVRDRNSLSPLGDATLVFFAGNEPEIWRVNWSDTNPAHYVTDQTGRFSGLFRFATYSGWLLVDLCNRKLKRITVVVTRQGYVGRRFTVKVADLQSRQEGDRTAIALPAFDLERAR